MKLRIRDNTLRFRLTQSEVDALGRGTAVEATTRIAPGQAFTYRLESAGDGQFSAAFSHGLLRVCAPAATVKGWAEGTEEGFAGELPVAGEPPLKVTVEKDFACLKPRDPAEDRDAFPHPHAAC
jgi:hypothetical protein